MDEKLNLTGVFLLWWIITATGVLIAGWWFLPVSPFMLIYLLRLRVKHNSPVVQIPQTRQERVWAAEPYDIHKHRFEYVPNRRYVG